MDFPPRSATSAFIVEFGFLGVLNLLAYLHYRWHEKARSCVPELAKFLPLFCVNAPYVYFHFTVPRRTPDSNLPFHTYLFTFLCFFTSLYFHWHEKIRSSVPFYVPTLSQFYVVFTLIAFCAYFLLFFRSLMHPPRPRDRDNIIESHED